MGSETRLCPPEPSPYPWLFYSSGRSDRNQFFCDITKPGKKVMMKNILVLRRKTILPCSHGWLFLWENNQCSLWNPVTLHLIQLPSLALGPKGVIDSSILSSPPDNPNSLIIIFLYLVPLVMFCRVGDQQWTEQTIREYCDDDTDGFCNPVYCNGKLYALTLRFQLLVEINQNFPDGVVIYLHERVPRHRDHSHASQTYMVESCGEIFLIYLIKGKLFLEVTGVEVFKLDFSIMKWIKVESAKDRCFFLSYPAAFSCPALDPENEGNRIYFTLRDDKNMYSFNIEEKTVSVSFPCMDLKAPWSSPIWVMPDFRLNSLHGKKQETKTNQIKDIVQSQDKEATETGYLCELPLDMLYSIASCLVLHDYMNFRIVNRTCQLAAPPIRWKTTLKQLAIHSLPPWLMVSQIGEDKCSFIDPWHRQRYLMNNPNKSNEVRLCYSKEGWCLMLQGYHTIFFWNPLTKKIILLPKLPQENKFKVMVGCDFSSSPDSSNCLLVLIYEDFPYMQLNCILVGEEHWESLYAFNWFDFKISYNNNPVFYNGELYLLDLEGNLGVFREDFIWQALDKPGRPCKSIHQSFLLQENGRLLSVFVGFMGKWLRVFELNLSRMAWVEVDNLGANTLYISRISSFSTTATTEKMKNKICLPKFCGDNLVYYSLDSKKYHCLGSNNVLDDFLTTKEQLYSGWIEPKW